VNAITSPNSDKRTPRVDELKRLDALPANWHWRTESDLATPQQWVNITQELNASDALMLARQNVGLVWWCDFQNAKQLLVAMQKRLEPRSPKKPQSAPQSKDVQTLSKTFHVHRLHRSEHLKLLSKLLIPIDTHLSIPLKRSPQVREVLSAVWGDQDLGSGKPHTELTELNEVNEVNEVKEVKELSPLNKSSNSTPTSAHQDPKDTPLTLVSLKELLGYIGAYEWQKKGVAINALKVLAQVEPNKSGGQQGQTKEPVVDTVGVPRIYPHYGVFSPVRGEYLDLLLKAPLPKALEGHSIAQDVGVGTGVLSAILLSRGVQKVVGTDTQLRALECAKDNLTRLGLEGRVQLLQTSLFADVRVPLIVCNPPWLPGKARSPMERAIFDPESAMLKGFLNGLQAHLAPEGEGWLIMSDLAQRLGLRKHGELEEWIEQAGLVVVGQLKAQPTHPKSSDTSDPFYEARRGETTSLWRLQSQHDCAHTDPMP